MFRNYVPPQIDDQRAKVEENKRPLENDLTRALVIVLERLLIDGLAPSFLTRLVEPGANGVAADFRVIAATAVLPGTALSLQAWPGALSRDPARRRVLVGVSGKGPSDAWSHERQLFATRSQPDAGLETPAGTLVFEVKPYELPLDAAQMVRYAREMRFPGADSIQGDAVTGSLSAQEAAAARQQLQPHLLEVTWNQVLEATTGVLAALNEGERPISHYLLSQFRDYLAIYPKQSLPYTLGWGPKSIAALSGIAHEGLLDARIRVFAADFAVEVADAWKARGGTRWRLANITEGKGLIKLGASGAPYFVAAPLGNPGMVTPLGPQLAGHASRRSGRKASGTPTIPESGKVTFSVSVATTILKGEPLLSLDLYAQAVGVDIFSNKLPAGVTSLGVKATVEHAAVFNWPEHWRAKRKDQMKKRGDWYDAVDGWLQKLANSPSLSPEVVVQVDAVGFRGGYLKWQCEGAGETKRSAALTTERWPDEPPATRLKNLAAALGEQRASSLADPIWAFPYWSEEPGRTATEVGRGLARQVRKPAISVQVPLTVPVDSSSKGAADLIALALDQLYATVAAPSRS